MREEEARSAEHRRPLTNFFKFGTDSKSSSSDVPDCWKMFLRFKIVSSRLFLRSSTVTSVRRLRISCKQIHID